MSKRWLQYKVCFLDEASKEQTIFVTTNYMEASEFASKYELVYEEVYIKSVWKISLPPPRPVERIKLEETGKTIQPDTSTDTKQPSDNPAVGATQKTLEK